MDSKDPNHSRRWYVVHTRPQKELLAAGLLEERLDVAAYLPEALQPYRGEMRLRPLFPRYLFVHADLAVTPASAFDSMPGVIRLVVFGGQALPVDEQVVVALRQEVTRLNAAGGLFRTTLRPGDRVRVRTGPLAGLEAVFVEPLAPGDRAAVLLDFLGRQNRVTVALADMDPAPEPAPRRRRRRGTRGRGRRVVRRKA